jgi:hypothetical protein
MSVPGSRVPVAVLRPLDVHEIKSSAHASPMGLYRPYFTGTVYPEPRGKTCAKTFI